jgi:two-component system, response regulator PdtaR
MGIIIVAEDDFIVSEYLSGILKEKGYSVIAVANADDAIAMFEHRNDVRMLITDINMPGPMNGLNLAATVRERWPFLKIIITTGRERPKIEEVPEGSLYLRKPYTPGFSRTSTAEPRPLSERPNWST